jgi:hypothetical protein
MITKVLAFELGVHPAEGDVLGVELPPHATARATAAATTKPIPNREAFIDILRRICAKW